jgi:membrane protease YdiL (CAAX protease family)
MDIRRYEMNKMRTISRQYPSAVFFVLTFILSWGVYRLADLVYNLTNSILLTLPIYILSFGPLVAALITSALIGGKAEVLSLLRKLTIWKVSWRWYVIALVLQPLLNLFAIYVNVLLGAPSPTLAAFGAWSALLGAFALRLVDPSDGPMLEELGWRGFAQEHLQKRYTPIVAMLILAVVVTIWHFKYIPMGGYQWIFIPGTIAVTLIYGWVYNATGGSVLLTLIMHATEPIINANFTGAYETRYLILRVSLYALAALIVVLFAGKNMGLKHPASMEIGQAQVITPGQA